MLNYASDTDSNFAKKQAFSGLKKALPGRKNGLEKKKRSEKNKKLDFFQKMVYYHIHNTKTSVRDTKTGGTRMRRLEK